MSSSSIQAVKNRSRNPSRQGLEAAAIELGHLKQKRKKDSNTKLYDIEVIAEDGHQVKVHYCGYSSEYDEWKPRVDVQYIKPNFESRDDKFSPLTELACSIKRRLLPSRSGDPEVRIQVPCDMPSFRVLRELGVPTCGGEYKGQYTIRQYGDLEGVLGARWYLRVVNEAGDFSYAILKTISFSFSRGKPFLEYEVERKEDNTLALMPVYVEQSPSLIFKFIRGDGNKTKLSEFI